MATSLSTVILTTPGAYLATLTNANRGYAFSYPVGVACRVNVQPHVNSAAVAFTESAIVDGTTVITASDHVVVAADGLFSFQYMGGRANQPAATQFVLASGTAGTKVLVLVEELGDGD